MNIISSLYNLRTCSYDLNEKNIEDKKYKVCLEYHIGNCHGHCEGFEEEENYNKNILEIKPDEIYNLAAQSQVRVSFDIPEYTANVVALGTLRILDTIKTLKLSKKIKFYQAGSSEMFGAAKPPQNEKTIFYPRSPYAVAKA